MAKTYLLAGAGALAAMLMPAAASAHPGDHGRGYANAYGHQGYHRSYGDRHDRWERRRWAQERWERRRWRQHHRDRHWR